MKNFTLKNNYSKNIKIFSGPRLGPRPARKFYIFTVIIFSILFLYPQISHASTEIYFNNNAKEILVGDSFTASLMISSPDKSINVIDGTLTYDKDKLEIKKVKTDDSVFSLWTEEPSFDNEKGELSFVGGIPNGFKGNVGEILQINFLAKNTGAVLVDFQDIFSVYENDGKGTQINPWLKPLSLTINKKVKPSLIPSLKNIFFKPSNYIWLLVLIVLFIIIKMFLKKKNKRSEK
jgi:hypothetical protein